MKTYIKKEDKDLLNRCVEISKPALLIGQTGIGKTTILNDLAKRGKKELHRISLNGSTSIDEIIGKFIPKGKDIIWQNGLLIEAMKKGDWVVFDEINSAMPDILFCLHSLLDDDQKITLLENDNQVVTPHKDFRFFATMNPSDEYIGTKELNPALKSRFYAILEISPLSNKREINLLKSRGAEDDIALELVSLARELRRMKDDFEISYFCSTRDLIQASELISDKISKETAIKFSIFNKMDSSDKQTVAEKDLIKNLNLIQLEDEEKLKEEIKKLTDQFSVSNELNRLLEKENVDKLLRIDELKADVKVLEDKIQLTSNTTKDDDAINKILHDTILDRDELIRKLEQIKKNGN